MPFHRPILAALALAGVLAAACARPGGSSRAELAARAGMAVRGGGGEVSDTAGDAGQALPHPAIAALAARLEADVAADSVGSIAAAVVADGRVLWEGAFGVADATAGRPATPETIYRAGSISKTVTALVLMRLVGRGLVGLDDPVSLYVPEVERLAGRESGGRPITLRDLASHTAGVAREPASSLAARGRMHRWDRKVVASIPLTELRSRPGEAYRYSNIGYGILGLALERAAGEPFEALVATHVLEPLGMTSSFYEVPRRQRGRLAAGYVNLEDGTVDPRVPRAEHRGRGYKVPNEGLYSTVGDLARLLLALVGDSAHAVLDSDARAVMLTDQTPGGDRQTGYGVGLQLTRLGGTLLAGHSGTVAGYASYLVLDPEARVGVVLLRNYNRGVTNLGSEAHRVVLELGGS
ncbi:MAG TPA: serine hydrolase domain-containing protein, partial [Longimicrobiales bacterium]|nr:serine hydrolase domain-containing protein [Longimicrobiales bacterium]